MSFEVNRRLFLAGTMAVGINPASVTQVSGSRSIKIVQAPATPNATRLQNYVSEFRSRFLTGKSAIIDDYRRVFTIDPSCFPETEALGIECAQNTLEETIISLDGGDALTEATWHRLQKRQSNIRLQKEKARRQLDAILGCGMHQPFGIYE